MQWLVRSPENRVDQAKSSPLIDFVRLKREEHIERKRRREMPPPPKRIKPPSRPKLDLRPDITPQPPVLDLPLDLELSMNLADAPYLGPVATGIDRDFIPISRQPPQYPYKAARRGIEGWVRLSFRVTDRGTVEDVKVLDSDPPRVFDQAAVKAVYAWRFEPRIVNGEPTAARAEQVVEFELDR
jgi:protein TonB